MLIVMIIARISGCASQRDASLEDQEQHAREFVAEMYDGDNVEFRVIATRGKGESLDRPELREIEKAIRSGELDLLIMEDLGRLVRGTEAARFCGIAVDHGVRVVAIHDGIDTIDPDWDDHVLSACQDHQKHNKHTSKRLKIKLMLRHKRMGAPTPLPIAGYIKPNGAISYHDWRVDESATPIIVEGAGRLRQTLNSSAVADFFNSVGFPTGPYCQADRWDGAMVRRFYSNPILKGKPGRGFRHTIKHHETGKRISVPNPEGAVFIEMDHLAHLSETEFDELDALLDERNKKMGRKPSENGNDIRHPVPKKRTRFPGQRAKCAYCGRENVWGGNGLAGNLQCNGSRQWKCWNSIGLNGKTFSERIVSEIVDFLFELKGFEDQFQQIIESVDSEPDINRCTSLDSILKDEQELNRKKSNLQDAIAEYGPMPMLQDKLEELDAENRRIAIAKAEFERMNALPDSPIVLNDIATLVQENFLELAIDSYEFGDMMRLIVPEVHVYLVRSCIGGHLRPRVRATIDLSGSIEDRVLPEQARDLLTRTVTLDVFEPTQPEAIRERVVELTAAGTYQRAIKDLLPEKPTQPAVQKALKLQAKMDELGIDSPYVVQYEPPLDYAKLRRHKNARYFFEPLPGYENPKI